MRTIIGYGVGLGALLALGIIVTWNVVSEELLLTTTAWIKYPLMALFLWLGLRNMRLWSQARLPFRVAFFSGMNISILAALVTPFVLWLYLADWDPQLLERIRENHFGGDVSPLLALRAILFQQFIGIAVTGLLFSGVGAFLLRSKST